MRGSIEKRGEGSWSIRLDLGTDPVTGKRQQKRVTFRGTKKEADKELTRLLKGLDEGNRVDDEKQTLSAFLDRWMKAVVVPNLADGTTSMYESRIRRYINPHLGNLQLGKVSALHLQEFYAKITRGPENEKGLAPQTVRIVHIILHSALKQALKWGLINRNPSDMVTVSRGTSEPKKVLDETGTRKLLAAMEDTRLRLPTLLLVFTGMRRGEMLALTWDNVEPDQGRIYVRQSLSKVKGRYSVNLPKTEKGKRVIPIAKMLVDELRPHKKEQATLQLKCGSAWVNRGLVYPNEIGDYMAPTAFSDVFVRYARKYGFDGTNPHALRHGHASILHQAGVSFKAISERLGHSSITITADLYTRVTATAQEGAGDKIESALFSPKGQRKRATS